MFKNNVTLDFDDEGWDWCEQFAVIALKNSLAVIEEIAEERDIEAWDAINIVLSYYLSKEDMIEFAHRDINPHWLNMLAEHRKEKI